MSDRADRIVEGYLRDVDRSLRRLPRAKRREILGELRVHIAEARGQGTDGEAAVRTLLERLGEPDEIAEAATEGSTPTRSRGSAVEVGALILLPVGGVVVPILGWVVGVALLWVSSRWSVREKLVGTLVLPGGLLPAAVVGLAAAPVMLPPVLGALVAVVLVAAPIWTTIYLATRLRSRNPSTSPRLAAGALDA